MRVLLDEGVPVQLMYGLLGHEVQTVARVGWAGKKNGELLRLAATQFDLFVTVDRSLLDPAERHWIITACLTRQLAEGEVEWKRN